MLVNQLKAPDTHKKPMLKGPALTERINQTKWLTSQENLSEGLHKTQYPHKHKGDNEYKLCPHSNFTTHLGICVYDQTVHLQRLRRVFTL